MDFFAQLPERARNALSDDPRLSLQEVAEYLTDGGTVDKTEGDTGARTFTDAHEVAFDYLLRRIRLCHPGTPAAIAFLHRCRVRNQTSCQGLGDMMFSSPEGPSRGKARYLQTIVTSKAFTEVATGRGSAGSGSDDDRWGDHATSLDAMEEEHGDKVLPLTRPDATDGPAVDRIAVEGLLARLEDPGVAPQRYFSERLSPGVVAVYADTLIVLCRCALAGAPPPDLRPVFGGPGVAANTSTVRLRRFRERVMPLLRECGLEAWVSDDDQ